MGNRGGGWLGSVVLLLAAAALLFRPWEGREASESGPGTADGTVTRVLDGDTVEVRIGGEVEDVRYIGVDTPETVSPDAPVQCFGPRASDFNHRLVEGERVHLVFGRERRDAYGRLLAYVYIRKLSVNEALLRRGFARTLSIPPNTRYSPLFARLEAAAAQAGRGLWGACPP